jgi:WD40 repeat protein
MCYFLNIEHTGINVFIGWYDEHCASSGSKLAQISVPVHPEHSSKYQCTVDKYTVPSVCFSHILRGHSGEVITCAWARHQPSILATGAADSKVILWDVRQVMRF